jgi:predicted ATP-grasp superfamily ATP-dependent carboligase
MNKKNVLVFPCGSEIGLEIYQSLKFSSHFHLIGGSSVEDHGIYTYDDYEGQFPFITSSDFLPFLKQFIKQRNIDIIYPTMDSVIAILKSYEKDLNCIVVGSSSDICNICNSKLETYQLLHKLVRTPVLLDVNHIKSYPVFVKPITGYGSRGASMIKNEESLMAYQSIYTDFLIMEYLPGDEYTIDCCSNRDAELIYVSPRIRQRIMNGISVSSIPVKDDELYDWAFRINSKMKFTGAWFFQVKKNSEDQYVLLEVACRIAGSSGLCRAKGVNLAELSLYIAMGEPVTIIENNLYVLTDRSLNTSYRYTDLQFDNVYVDLDDTLIINQSRMNTYLISKLYEYVNSNKRLILITKHQYDLKSTLARYRISELFDQIIHLNKLQKKSDFINNPQSIFIDDSFSERKDVSEKCKIPVFSPNLLP